MNQPGQPRPGPGDEQVPWLEAGQLPPALERELAGLTAPIGEPSAELADRAWETSRVQAEPKVLVLRRWLAPATIAASLVLVGLAVTSRTPASHSAKDLALGRVPVESTSLRVAGGGPERVESTEETRRELAMRGVDEVRNSATLEQKVISQAGKDAADADRERAGRLKAESQAAPAPAPAAPAAAEPPARKLTREQEEPYKSKAAAELNDKVAAGAKSEDKLPASEAARGAAKPTEPPPADRGDAAPAATDPAFMRETLVPGGNTSQSRAASQFDAQPWHRDQSEAGSGGSAGAPRQAAQEPDAAQTPTLGWARRVFVQGKWWWIGIAVLNAALFLYWRRRLARARSEPAPDQ
jgi:hypothetical protein